MVLTLDAVMIKMKNIFKYCNRCKKALIILLTTSWCCFFFLFFKRFYLFIFWQRGREGERGVEKHQCGVASYVPPTGDLAHNSGMCPDWESNWGPFGLQDNMQSTEPHQPGLIFYIKLWLHKTQAYIMHQVSSEQYKVIWYKNRPGLDLHGTQSHYILIIIKIFIVFCFHFFFCQMS